MHWFLLPASLPKYFSYFNILVHRDISLETWSFREDTLDEVGDNSLKKAVITEADDRNFGSGYPGGS